MGFSRWHITSTIQNIKSKEQTAKKRHILYKIDNSSKISYSTINYGSRKWTSQLKNTFTIKKHSNAAE